MSRPSPPSAPFWRTRTLEEMTPEEWESLCDGCGRCCLVKLEDEDTGQIEYTDVACTLLDGHSCRCRDYPNRQGKVADCVPLPTTNAEPLAKNVEPTLNVPPLKVYVAVPPF